MSDTLKNEVNGIKMRLSQMPLDTDYPGYVNSFYFSGSCNLFAESVTTGPRSIHSLPHVRVVALPVHAQWYAIRCLDYVDRSEILSS
jgi:hypothetical protein